MKSKMCFLSTARAVCFGLALTGLGAPLIAAEPTAVQIDLGRQLVLASGASRSIDGIIPNLVAQTTRTLTQTRPELKAQLEEAMTTIRPEIDARKDEMLTLAARIFASDLSEQELKESVAFFSSASGKKYVNSQPDMLNKLVTTMQAWQRVLSSDMIDRLRTELKKKNVEF